jgi:hypothetical protein
MFIMCGALRSGALLGKPDACIGAFSASGILHDVGLWGLGRGMELWTTLGFFMLMGVGGMSELAFEASSG